jgi:hypothetical protein
MIAVWSPDGPGMPTVLDCGTGILLGGNAFDDRAAANAPSIV